MKIKKLTKADMELEEDGITFNGIPKALEALRQKVNELVEDTNHKKD